MTNQQAVVVLDVESWFVEMQTVYQSYNTTNPMEFTFEDFSELTSAITDVVQSPLGFDRANLHQYALHVFSGYMPADIAVKLVDKYIMQLNVQLEHTNSSMLPALNLRYRSWLTSGFHLYIAYDNRESISSPTEYTRAGLLAAIEHGDFINERTRRAYGL